MPLTPRERFRLKISLADKYPLRDSARQVASAAGIVTLTIQNEGMSPIDLWEKILQKAEKTNRLVPLMQKVSEQHPNDYEYPIWLKEVESGFPTRMKKLAQDIRDGHCLLFMGSGTLLCGVQDVEDAPFQTTTFNRAFAKSLADEMHQQFIYYDKREMYNLAYIAQRYSELTKNIPGTQGKLAKEFYKYCRPDTRLYEKLAQLPWQVVINTNPDSELATILNQEVEDEEQNVERVKPRCIQRYYNIANNVPSAHSLPQPIEPLKAGQTLLYNIFGSFEDRPSMVLTESQLLDFTNRVLDKNPALHPLVMDEFTVDENTPKSYLFLGFDFDQWYVKIVFQTVLKLTKQENRSYSIFPLGVGYNQFNRDFFEEEFKCYFIDYDLLSFVDDLVIAYREL